MLDDILFKNKTQDYEPIMRVMFYVTVSFESGKKVKSFVVIKNMF